MDDNLHHIDTKQDEDTFDHAKSITNIFEKGHSLGISYLYLSKVTLRVMTCSPKKSLFLLPIAFDFTW